MVAIEDEPKKKGKNDGLKDLRRAIEHPDETIAEDIDEIASERSQLPGGGSYIEELHKALDELDSDEEEK